MSSFRELIEEYDLLGDVTFSTPQDYTRRQRHLESWAAKARDVLVELERQRRDASRGTRDVDGQGATAGLPPEG